MSGATLRHKLREILSRLLRDDVDIDAVIDEMEALYQREHQEDILNRIQLERIRGTL